MNEADLYSFQRREFNRQDINENIRIMKKKLKVIRRRIKINREKIEALRNFDKKAKEQYKVLKPIKVLSSTKDYDISFMKKEFYNYRTNKNDKKNIIAEVDEKDYTTKDNNKIDLDDDNSDDIDDYSDKMRNKNKRIKKEDKNNIIITEVGNEDDNKNNNKNYICDIDNDDNNKAKSK